MRSAAFVVALAGTALAGYAPPVETTTCTTSTTEAPMASHYVGKPTWTTEVVTAITTYCPYATEVVHKGQTYTVTEATTLTITNCPCTVTKPVYTSVVSQCTDCAAPSVAPAPGVAAPAPAPVAPAPAVNGTKPAPYSPPTQQTNAAGKLTAAGAGILAVFGLVAAL